jgi:F0F1-type ATP synthase membrane subunit c/vacuolar-type H+-ATPase subunit K
MITLTVIVLALGLGWAINKAWSRAAEAVARKPVAAKAAESAALN